MKPKTTLERAQLEASLFALGSSQVTASGGAYGEVAEHNTHEWGSARPTFTSPPNPEKNPPIAAAGKACPRTRSNRSDTFEAADLQRPPRARSLHALLSVRPRTARGF